MARSHSNIRDRVHHSRAMATQSTSNTMARGTCRSSPPRGTAIMHSNIKQRHCRTRHMHARRTQAASRPTIRTNRLTIAMHPPRRLTFRCRSRQAHNGPYTQPLSSNNSSQVQVEPRLSAIQAIPRLLSMATLLHRLDRFKGLPLGLRAQHLSRHSITGLLNLRSRCQQMERPRRAFPRGKTPTQATSRRSRAKAILMSTADNCRR